MARLGSLLVLLFAVLCSFGYAQREIEKGKEIRIEPPKPPAPPRRQPRKPTSPQNRTQGVLLVLTDPATAKVTIKNSRGDIAKQGDSESGEFSAELPPGKYDVEVTASKYYPYAMGKGILVTASRAKTVQAFLKATTGSMIIGPVDPDVTILIDQKNPADLNIKVSTKKEEKQLQLDDVPEGFHRLTITGPNIADWKREEVEVRGGSRSIITPTFQSALVNLVVKSEPEAEIYVDGVMVGKTPDSGELRIPDKYRPGQYTFRAEKGFFEPTQERKNVGVDNSVVQLKLTRIKSSPEFGDDFHEGLKFWDTPSSWQVTRSVLAIRGSEAGLQVGLVKDKNYTDFKMTLDIRFTNSKGAVWIVRARDKRNFYLFQLYGPKGANPKFFRSYIARNGQMTMLTSAVVYQDLTRPNDSYKITIEAKGPTIRHFIQLNSDATGGSQPFSTLQDSTFLYGTVGLGSYEGEEFVVSFVTVLPDESASR
jgi:hypothetical protein